MTIKMPERIEVGWKWSDRKKQEAKRAKKNAAHRRSNRLRMAKRSRKINRVGMLLLVLLMPAVASAQSESPVARPGDSVYWCPDRYCNVRDKGWTDSQGRLPKIPPNACDPWADGVFSSTDVPCTQALVDVGHCTRQQLGQMVQNPDIPCFYNRYSYPPAWRDGGWFGGLMGAQHGISYGAIQRAWEALTGKSWGGCSNRSECDMFHTAGAVMGCTLSPCMRAQCPGFPAIPCPAGGSTSGPPSCGSGWICEPLSTVPKARRPGAPSPSERDPNRTIRAVADKSFAPAGACYYPGYTASHGVLYVKQRPGCFDLSSTCSTVASLKLECWEASIPPPPVCGDGTCDPNEDCPADCGAPPVDPPTPAPSGCLDLLKKALEACK